VTPSINDATSTHPQSLAARLAWTILILATLYLCYFHNLGAIGLVGPDEPRYAWIARDMAETGDWITPHLYGMPWFEKPPLYYWSAALSFKLFGVSETTARLASAIYTLLATLAMARLAWRIYGAETARWFLLLLPTTVAMIAFSHAAATDMPFAATLTIAMVFAAQLLGLTSSPTTERNSSGGYDSSVPAGPSAAVDSSSALDSSVALTSSGGHDFSRAEKPPNARALAPEVSDSSTPIHRSTVLAAIFFGFFLGLAVLAKGPAAIILAGGSVLLWTIFTKRWRDAFRCLHPLAIAAFCATALPWYILCARRNPDFFRIFIIEHNFKRFLTPEFQHIQPFWYYAGILLVAFLPWTLLLLYSAVRGSLDLWRTKAISPATLFLLCWSLFVLLFFSISKSKLPGYILPAIPAIGLPMARGYVRAVNRNNDLLRWLLVAAGGLTMLASIPIFFLHLGANRSATNTLHAVAWILLSTALANLLLSSYGATNRRVTFLSPLCVAPILLLLCFYPHLQCALLAHYDPSGKTLAADVAARNISPETLLVGHMQRGQQFGLSFYLHREIRTWFEEPKEGYLLLKSRNCEELVAAPWICSAEPVYLERSAYFLYRVSASR
jgi:4-amino-4-deoxy-L-arabinose transferase-like glycosyltransferase